MKPLATAIHIDGSYQTLYMSPPRTDRNATYLVAMRWLKFHGYLPNW